MSFIIFDTEYTTWLGCQKNGWKGNQKKEIVQISALKVSNQLEVISEFNILCKPVINPILSNYFVQLTHITNEQVEKHGESFLSVFQKFESFVGNDICYSHAWGKDYNDESDGNIIKENILLNKISNPKTIIYRNIAFVFNELYKKNNIKIKKQSSGQIAKLLGIENDIAHIKSSSHNAFYDVYSILTGLKYFFPDSIQLIQKMK